MHITYFSPHQYLLWNFSFVTSPKKSCWLQLSVGYNATFRINQKTEKLRNTQINFAVSSISISPNLVSGSLLNVHGSGIFTLINQPLYPRRFNREDMAL